MLLCGRFLTRLGVTNICSLTATLAPYKSPLAIFNRRSAEGESPLTLADLEGIDTEHTDNTENRDDRIERSMSGVSG